MKIAKLATYLLLGLIFNGCLKVDLPETDTCANIICYNDGPCWAGTCVCMPGWEGADCTIQRDPLEIRITRIRITRFPATNNGVPWDAGDDADIYLEITDQNQNTVYINTEADVINNADPNRIHTFVVDEVFTDVNQSYSVRLYDKDSGMDEFIDGMLVLIYDDANRFPETLIFDRGTGFAFEMDVSYTLP
eukprot:Plantae.Rhodophyta-Purpureofilum_apyrenoidigerum.ctg25045.p1 GENE.Plantae.Rhodophyta-Purpureofilum_apyrenoidigerum.ctg25045~~Plantae.Rhodophyta-Purpureofilum_apyrenoidigerum.ctg25045.p1  ORF type:complete len:191 (+),score=7.46 Plantae.Rhodophyta-Purpureofilum_apyrenoidigerum.ctg25045:348-920(+)